MIKLLPYEVWRDIKGYEGLYQISARGRVKSLDRLITNRIGVTKFWKGRILKLDSGINGYPLVDLSKNGSNIKYLVHRLVASVFLPNPGNLPFINHKNGITSNANAYNLEWCTPSQNTIHSFEVLKRDKYYKREVVGINIKTGKGVYFKTIAELSINAGLSVKYINKKMSYKAQEFAGMMLKYKVEGDVVKCKSCGTTFTPNRPSTNPIYCSRKCRSNTRKKAVVIKNIKNGDSLKFDSITGAANYIHCETSQLYQCIKGTRKTAKGYTINLIS